MRLANAMGRCALYKFNREFKNNNNNVLNFLVETTTKPKTHKRTYLKRWINLFFSDSSISSSALMIASVATLIAFDITLLKSGNDPMIFKVCSK